ncbi:unnamed protein product, partial [Ceratitis capitata]
DTTSPHQLSVTWATPPYDTHEHDWRQRSESADASLLRGRLRRYSSQEEKPYEFACKTASPVDGIESLPQGQQQLNEGYIGGNASVSANNDSNNNKHSEDNDNDEDEIDDEEDYSVSVSAIIQRRASVRGYRGKRGSRYSRRASSPMDHLMDTVERRRSSVYTTSSDEGTNQESTQEQIFENIRLHKEVIQSVKLQPWPMRKKLKLVRQYFATNKDETDSRKRMTEHEYKVAGNFFTFWEFEGYIKYSPMFYGTLEYPLLSTDNSAILVKEHKKADLSIRPVSGVTAAQAIFIVWMHNDNKHD